MGRSIASRHADGPRAEAVATPRRPEAAEARKLRRDADKLMVAMIQAGEHTKRDIARIFNCSVMRVFRAEERVFAAHKRRGLGIPTRRYSRPDVALRFRKDGHRDRDPGSDPARQQSA